MTRVFAYTPAENDRTQLGLRVEWSADAPAILRVQVTSPWGCVRLGRTNIARLQIPVREALERGATTMVLNLRDCLDIDGAALGVLVSMRNAFAQAGGTVVIEAADEDLRALFAAHDVEDRFTFATSERTP